MARARRAADALHAKVEQRLLQAAQTGETLTATLLSRRVGCRRTVLYTNTAVKARLMQAGILSDPPVPVPQMTAAGDRAAQEPTVAERRLRAVEHRAHRLELGLADAQEQRRQLQGENDRLRLRNRLLAAGRALL